MTVTSRRPVTPVTPVRPLRIVQLVAMASGGVVKHAQQVSAELVKNGNRVILARPADVDLNLPGCLGIDINIREKPMLSDLRQIRRLRRVIRDADVVHAHGARAGSFAVIAAAGLRRRPRIIVTLHNLPGGSAAVATVGNALITLVSRRADYVLAVSPDLVELSRNKGAKRVSLALIPAPTLAASTPGNIRTELGIANATPMLLTVARLVGQKGLDLLLEVAAEVKQRYEGEWAWHIVGDGPLENELQRDISAQKLPITLLGRRTDVANFLADADLVVSTSRWEGQPISLQEAVLAGKPIIATDVGGTAAVLQGAGQLVSCTAGDLAGAIIEVLTDTKRRSELAQKSAERAKELPTILDVMNQLQPLYESEL